MNNRYRALVAVTSLALALAVPGMTPRPLASCAPVSDLYSQRGLRRMRTLLQLRLLELRKAELNRIRLAIKQQIPVDALVRAPSPAQEVARRIQFVTGCFRARGVRSRPANHA